MDQRRQTRKSLILALAVLLSWAGLEWMAVYAYPWTPLSIALSPLLIASLTWLDVGLFIIAHDCMHGVVAPGVPWINRSLGKLCLLVYAGFDFEPMRAKHQEHHRHPGTERDPDFARDRGAAFWPWYLGFFRAYSTLRQMLVISALFWLVVLVSGASIPKLLVFWALPSILSSLQLFYFGTYLPHRPHGVAFVDAHRARSNAYPTWLSLLSCFHFGYHHEHHLHPELPWWQLPAARART